MWVRRFSPPRFAFFRAFVICTIYGCVMEIQSLKQACRKAAFAARKQAHGLGLDNDANAQLMAFLKNQNTDHIIAAYMPIRTEVSPLPTMIKMVARGRRICVPVILGNGQPLEFHEWRPDTQMVDGPFGASIPKDAAVLKPDIVITPLVAFDPNGYRLGYGGGFYDRSFEQLSASKDIQAIGFAYADQEVMLVPRESTDYQLDGVITEKGILSF